MKEPHFHGCHLDLTRKLEATVGHARALTMREVIESFYKDCIEPSLPEVRRENHGIFICQKSWGRCDSTRKMTFCRRYFLRGGVL